jgi:tetratricopeptide (TPR) repeat protein
MTRCCLPLAFIFLLNGLILSPPQAAAQVDERPRVSSDLQVWADENRNGFLEPHEVERLTVATIELLLGPHPGRTPIDGMFDLNGDGIIDPDELLRARTRFFRAQVLRLVERNPELARELDLDDNGRIDEREADLVTGYLFVDEKVREPHRVASPIDRIADRNRDGRVGPDEVDLLRGRVARAVSLMPFAPDGMREPVRETRIETPMEPPIEAREQAQREQAPLDQAPAAAPAAQAALSITASIDPIFPVFLKYYDTHPIGKAVLKNAGTAPLEKIKVQLIVKEYMTDKKQCAAPDRLEPGEQKEVELYALFTKSVLDISESTKAQANISVEYTASGQAKTEELVETVSFLNRNNMTWDDNDRIAAFVATNDKSVMLFRSAAVGVVDQTSTALDAGLRTAIAVHELLALYGMKYWADPKSSYATITAKESRKTDVDYLQFPEQTLQLKTGDCDDLSILWSALLEASSVETAFVTVPGHIFIAFALTMQPAEAKSYLRAADLIEKAGKAWVPVEVTSIKDGFLKAWEAGAREWKESEAKGQAGFFPFADARAKYAPVGFSAAAPSYSLPADSSLAPAYASELKKLVDRETATQVAALQAEIKKDAAKPEPVNKLGVLYAKYGDWDRAAAEFSRAVKISASYVPAFVNAGNIAFLKGEPAKALEYYEKAQKKAPDKTTVLLGIARANHELENYGRVKEAYARLKAVDAQLAAQFTYLDLQGTEATRAADVGGVKQTVVWDEK